MTWLTICLIFAVGGINIALNDQAQRTAAAARATGWLSGMASSDFLLLFVIGCASLTSLYSLYFQGIVLARGLLLMGAISILGGAVFGVLYRKNVLEPVEYTILFLIGALFFYRAFFKSA